jgi:hypothetical protein
MGTSDITIRIDIVRGAEGARSSDSIDVILTPSLTRIANSGVSVNSTRTPNNWVEGRIRYHSGLFPTAVQNIKIYIQKEGEPPILARDLIGGTVKPNASAVIDVPDYLALISPATDSVAVTRPVSDVDVKWKYIGPATTFQVKVTENVSHGVVFNREGISGNHVLVPASTFETGKKYCFQVIGRGRGIGKPSGPCAPGSSIYINTYVQCYITFTAK